MNCELRKRKDWSENAVSEVVGNILILMITVVLFSGIMAFVSQLPVPQQVTKADFSAGITFNTAGTEADLTLTHAGGDSLDAAQTLIIWDIDSVTYSQQLSTDTSFAQSSWTMGVDWARHLTGLNYASSISVTVYDLEKNSAIWTGQVSGGTTGTPPSILQRYADSNNATPSVDPIKQYDNFTLFVKIIDLDGDLNTVDGVWVDSSSITGGSVTDMPDRSAGGWYEWDFIDAAKTVEDIDGKVIVIHAMDEASHESVASFVVSVIVLPTDIDLLPYDTSPSVGESGLPAYLSWISQRQGFGVYKENLSAPGTANVSLPSTIFVQGEKVFVRVGSLDLSNVFGANLLTLTDTRTGYSSTAYADFILASTEEDPFYAYSSGGNAFVYEAKFETTDLAPSSYAMHIELMSGTSGSYVFQIDQIITITAEDSPISFIPAIWLFNGAGVEWGTKTHPFEVSSTTYLAYVNIYVQDTGSVSDAKIEDVRVVDMSGSPKLNGAVPSGSMISSVSLNTSTPDSAYRFSIDLRLNNQDQWLEGTNAYTLFISRFTDANEGEYSISKQIYVKAAMNKADFLIGTVGMYASQSQGSGSSNFQPPQYMFYVENNNFFTMRVLFDYSNSPGATLDYWVTAMATGDLDGDGDEDALMGQYYSNYLYYFENSMNTYGSWQEGSVITRPDGNTTRIKWIATGDINGDGDTDFAYATSGNRVVIYNNTYGSKGVYFPKSNWTSTNDGIRKIALADMTRDGKADLIVLASGRVEIYDLKSWTGNWIATVPITTVTPVNIEDFDIYDVNGDEWLDVITTDPHRPTSGTGYVHTDIDGVWINKYSAATGVVRSLNTDPSATVCLKGTISAGTAASTGTQDGTFMSIVENAEGTDYTTTPLGAVDCRFQFQTLSSALDQELRVYAKVKTGHQESFYLWYSIQSSPATLTTATIWTPLLTINSESFTEQRVPLPSTVAGKALMIRFTDSNNATSSTGFVDQLDVDFIGVYSNTFGGYTDRYNVFPWTSSSSEYLAVRAGDLDGDAYADIVVGKNGNWTAYENTSILSKWWGASSTMYVEGSTKGAPSTAVASFLAYVSPTLFDLVDINGDGYDDVVVSNYTVNSAIISQVGVWLNLMNAKWFVEVKDLTDMFSPDDVKGGMTWLLVADLTEGE